MKKKYRVISKDITTSERIVEAELPDAFVPATGYNHDDYMREQAVEAAHAQQKKQHEKAGIIYHENLDTRVEPFDGK